jgi:hypothetical protein
VRLDYFNAGADVHFLILKFFADSMDRKYNSIA